MAGNGATAEGIANAIKLVVAKKLQTTVNGHKMRLVLSPRATQDRVFILLKGGKDGS